MSLPPHALEIDPESSLQFTITRGPAKDGSDDVSRCTMTLRHPGHTNKYLAFKVSSLFLWKKFEFDLRGLAGSLGVALLISILFPLSDNIIVILHDDLLF